MRFGDAAWRNGTIGCAIDLASAARCPDSDAARLLIRTRHVICDTPAALAGTGFVLFDPPAVKFLKLGKRHARLLAAQVGPVGNAN